MYTPIYMIWVFPKVSIQRLFSLLLEQVSFGVFKHVLNIFSINMLKLNLWTCLSQYNCSYIYTHTHKIYLCIVNYAMDTYILLKKSMWPRKIVTFANKTNSYQMSAYWYVRNRKRDKIANWRHSIIRRTFLNGADYWRYRAPIIRIYQNVSN